MRGLGFGLVLLVCQVVVGVARELRAQNQAAGEEPSSATEASAWIDQAYGDARPEGVGVTEPMTKAAATREPAEPVEPPVPTRVTLTTDRGTTFSPLSLTGGSEIVGTSAPDKAAGKFQRARRLRRELHEAGEVAAVVQEVDGLVLMQVCSGEQLGEVERCCTVPASAPAMRAIEAASPTRPPRTHASSRVWRGALTRAALTCPCPSCSGFLVMLKGLGRGSVPRASG